VLSVHGGGAHRGISANRPDVREEAWSSGNGMAKHIGRERGATTTVKQPQKVSPFLLLWYPPIISSPCCAWMNTFIIYYQPYRRRKQQQRAKNKIDGPDMLPYARIHRSLTYPPTTAQKGRPQSRQSLPGRLSPEHRRPGLPERKKMGPAATRTRGLSQMCLDRLDSRALSENHTTSCYVVSMLLIRSGLN
jgi:hypothetical protein